MKIVRRIASDDEADAVSIASLPRSVCRTEAAYPSNCSLDAVFTALKGVVSDTIRYRTHFEHQRPDQLTDEIHIKTKIRGNDCKVGNF